MELWFIILDSLSTYDYVIWFHRPELPWCRHERVLMIDPIDESWGNNCEHLNTLVVVAMEANQPDSLKGITLSSWLNFL